MGGQVATLDTGPMKRGALASRIGSGQRRGIDGFYARA